MNLQTNKQKGINLTRKIDAMAYLQKKGEIMPKHIMLRGNVLYADCKFMGVHIRDSLGTNIPKIAERKLDHLRTLVEKGEYHSSKKTFEELADEWLETRDLKKPHHISQEQRVRVHLKSYFGELKVRDLIKVDEKTGP